MRLTDAGASFLVPAQALLAAHEAALMEEDAGNPSVAIGISDHVLGTSLPDVIRTVRLGLPARTKISVRLGLSHEIGDLFERGVVDVALLRRDGGGSDGEVLGGSAELVWRRARPRAGRCSAAGPAAATLPQLPGSRVVLLAHGAEAHHARAANMIAAATRKLLSRV